jgi:hypothetical protein
MADAALPERSSRHSLVRAALYARVSTANNGQDPSMHLLPRFGSLPIAAIDEKRVQEFIADLTRMEYTWPNGVSRKLSPKSVRNIVGVLKQVLA